MPPPSLLEQLDLLIRSRTPILWIRTLEEDRVLSLLQQVSRTLGERALWSWDFISGLQGTKQRVVQCKR